MNTIVEYIVACALFAIAAFSISFLISLEEIRLGLFQRKGTVLDWMEKLQAQLALIGAKIRTIDVAKGIIEVDGIVVIVRKIIEINNAYGDTIAFRVSQKAPDEVTIDVVGRRRWNSRCSYTKKEITERKYTSQKIEEIMSGT
jgi:hypothetical protein